MEVYWNKLEHINGWNRKRCKILEIYDVNDQNVGIGKLEQYGQVIWILHCIAAKS